MGVFDKLKNVFFEEEYVEVEEPVKKVKKEKKEKKEKPTIAKKIELPEMPRIREEKTEREKEIEEEVVERVEKKLANQGFIAKAPENVIEEEKAKGVKYRDTLKQIEERLAALK